MSYFPVRTVLLRPAEGTWHVDDQQQPDKIDSTAPATRIREALHEASRAPRLAAAERLSQLSLLSVIVATLAMAVWLLVSKDARILVLKRLVRQNGVGQSLTVSTRDLPPLLSPRPEPVPVLEPKPVATSLPAPGPRRPATPDRSQAEQARSPVSAPTAEPVPAPRPDLDRGGATLVPSGEGSETEAPRAAAPSSGPQISQEAASAAYELVLSVRGGMRRLVSQEPSRWQVVKEDNGVLWIDIVIAGNGEDHYIWAVGLQKGTVEPLSQAARNLEE